MGQAQVFENLGRAWASLCSVDTAIVRFTIVFRCYFDKINVYIKLTIGFEINIQNNSNRKIAKYGSLTYEHSLSYSKAVFVNLSWGISLFSYRVPNGLTFINYVVHGFSSLSTQSTEGIVTTHQYGA